MTINISLTKAERKMARADLKLRAMKLLTECPEKFTEMDRCCILKIYTVAGRTAHGRNSATDLGLKNLNDWLLEFEKRVR